MRVIILHVYMKVSSGKRDAFLEQAKRVTEGTVAEGGNISYHLYEDTVEPNAFILVEKWQDAASLEQHGQTAHFQAFMSAVQELNLLLTPPQLERYEVTA